MKAALLILSGLLMANDPGCGAGVGANTANGPDGGTTSDGGAGTGTGTPTGTRTRMTCGDLGSHYFCDDFSASALPSSFDSQALSAGTLQLDVDEAVSAPQSLLASTLSITTGTRTFARLEKKFAHDSTRFILDYSQRVDASCIGPYDGVETGMIGLRTNTYWVALRYGNTDAILEATSQNGLYIQSHQLRTQLKRDAWVHVKLDVDLARKVVGLTVDGEVVVHDEPLRYAQDGATAPNIAVGTLTDNLTFKPSACQVRIDDVAFDIEP